MGAREEMRAGGKGKIVCAQRAVWEGKGCVTRYLSWLGFLALFSYFSFFFFFLLIHVSDLFSVMWLNEEQHFSLKMGIPLFQLLTPTQVPSEWGKCRICSHILQSGCPLRVVRKPPCMWRCSTAKQPLHSNRHIAFCFILSWVSPRFCYAQIFSSWLPLTLFPPQWLSDGREMS